MNFLNALGFVLLGTVMHFAPVVAPGLLMESHTHTLSATSVIWLQFMAWVLRGIGVLYSAKFAFSLGWALMETRVRIYRERVVVSGIPDAQPEVVGVSA